MEQTAVCAACGEPYKVFDGYAFDQTACSACRSAAAGGSLRDRLRAS